MVGLERFGPFAQDVLLDLAGGGLRQFAEDHRLGHLEAGQVLPAPTADVGFAGVFPARLEGNEGARCLAPFLVGLGDHGGVGGVKACLLLVEQLLRNVSGDARWAAKPVCLGLGVLFAYDLYLYSQAMMFQEIDEDALGGIEVQAED